MNKILYKFKQKNIIHKIFLILNNNQSIKIHKIHKILKMLINKLMILLINQIYFKNNKKTLVIKMKFSLIK